MKDKEETETNISKSIYICQRYLSLIHDLILAF